MDTPGRNARSCLRAALAVSLFASLPAAAADDLYAAERAACMQRPEAERGACLREAAAARQAARRGDLSGNGGALEANRAKRCEALPAADRDACVRRAREEGTVSGSVEGGGILREYREIILPPVPAEPAVALPQQEPPVTTPAPAGTALVPPPVVPAPPAPAPAGVMLQPAQ